MHTIIRFRGVVVGRGLRSGAGLLALWTALPVPWLYPSTIHAAASFYEGKTLTIIQGRSAGGLGDVRVNVRTGDAASIGRRPSSGGEVRVVQ